MGPGGGSATGIRGADGTANMTIRRRGRLHIVDTAGARLTWDERRLTWALERGRQTWESAPPAADAIDAYAVREAILPMQNAAKITTTPWASAVHEGVVCRLSGFRGLPRGCRLELVLTVALEMDSGNLLVTIDGETEGLRLRRIRWPGPVTFAAGADQETVIPFMQGALIPGAWPRDVPGFDAVANGRALYMPWWGQRRGAAGYLAILETHADAGCRITHPPGGPTHIGPRWDGCLDRIAYPRSLRYAFFDRCDYVSFAKHYRRYVMRERRFVSLREKIAACPKVTRLIGAPVIHTTIAHDIHPRSRFHDASRPEANTACVSFRRRAAQLCALRARGIPRAYVHLDGWGRGGYDSHHPEPLPPHRKAGGWDGLRGLADTCRRIGYLLALHDQYRDYYHNAPTFSPANALQDAEGHAPLRCVWYGGPQSLLCARLAPAYVRRNHEALRRRGVRIDGSYLDCFAASSVDECFHPAHRMTRAECMALRQRCFGIIRDLEGIVSSEEPIDYAVPDLHLAHHGPYVIAGWVMKHDVELPVVPLWNLVYHDALMLPWAAAAGPGVPGIPPGDCAAAHAAINGGMSYLEIEPSREDVVRIRRLCRLHERVALEEMVSHEVLDAERTRQRTAFADGTVVTADVRRGTWQVS